ncbi:MAG: hypothetical protein SCH71_16615 [Desulfobulbaceae bacterium]|nr:hypothetical protein [Desulfobulbaceae bacterium]
MTGKKETACKWYPGRFLASGSKRQKHNNNFQYISQVRRSFRLKAFTLIIRPSLWGLFFLSWAG